MFRVGQKVVCISGPIEAARGYNQEVQPAIGHVYTIRSIDDFDDAPPHMPHFGVGLLLEEITCPVHSGFGLECSFSSRFRPIVERKTDISIFTEMLTPSPQRVREMSEG